MEDSAVLLGGYWMWIISILLIVGLTVFKALKKA